MAEKPTREVSAAELIGKYLNEGGPSKVWDIERILGDGERIKSQVRLQLLRAEEDLDALQKAQETARKAGETAEYGDIYREAQAHEILWRALVSVEQHEIDKKLCYPPLFVSVLHLRKSFTAAELAVLLNCYELTKAEYSPLETLEKESAETWVARLSDPLRGPLFMSRLDSLHWPALTVLMAQVSRDLLLAAGHELPSLLPTSESTPIGSDSDTGSSGAQLSASSTSDPGLKVPTGELLTKEKAAEILRKRRESRDE